jgi:hypothetical protein
VGKLRYSVGLLLLALVLVVGVERLLFPGEHPLLYRLEAADRKSLYEIVTTFTGALLGFMIAALAILVSLDPARPIVQELRRGESFSLLVVNMLAAILFLFLLTVSGIGGRVFDDAKHGSDVFETVYEVLLVVSVLEFALAGFYFAVVTYKAGSYK